MRTLSHFAACGALAALLAGCGLLPPAQPIAQQPVSPPVYEARTWQSPIYPQPRSFYSQPGEASVPYGDPEPVYAPPHEAPRPAPWAIQAAEAAPRPAPGPAFERTPVAVTRPQGVPPDDTIGWWRLPALLPGWRYED